MERNTRESRRPNPYPQESCISFQADRYNYVHKTAITDSWIWCRSWRSNMFSAADMSSWPTWHLILLVHHRELRDFHFAASALLICLPLCSSKPRPKVSALLWCLPRTTGYRVPTLYAPSMLPSILLILFFSPQVCSGSCCGLHPPLQTTKSWRGGILFYSSFSQSLAMCHMKVCEIE